MVGTVASDSSSIVWLLLCFIAQILNYTQMLNRLPPDQLNTPFCGMLLYNLNFSIMFQEQFTFKKNWAKDQFFF